VCNLPAFIKTYADCDVAYYDGGSDEFNEKPEVVPINTKYFLHKFTDSAGV
jgi:hypothetical protein